MFNSLTKPATLMKNPSTKKLKSISILFLVAGAWGISMGLFYFTNPNFLLTALGIVNLTLGIFLGFRQMRKDNKDRLDGRKKNNKKNS